MPLRKWCVLSTEKSFQDPTFTSFSGTKVPIGIFTNIFNTYRECLHNLVIWLPRMEDSKFCIVLQAYLDADQGTIPGRANVHDTVAWAASIAQGDLYEKHCSCFCIVFLLDSGLSFGRAGWGNNLTLLRILFLFSQDLTQP